MVDIVPSPGVNANGEPADTALELLPLGTTAQDKLNFFARANLPAALGGAVADAVAAAVPGAIAAPLNAALRLDLLSTAAKTSVGEALNEVNENIRAHTPSRYGAKLDVRYDLTATTTANSNVVTVTSPNVTFTDADIGKTMMIANAAATTGNDNDLVSTIASIVSGTQVRLADPALATVTNASMHYGTDDTKAFQDWLDGCYAARVAAKMPYGREGLVQQPPLRYNRTQSIELCGNIVIGNGWGGSFALTDKQFGITSNPVMGYSENCSFNGYGGAIIMSSAGASILGGTGKRRKGFGPAYTDKITINNFQVKGSRTSKEYFAVQPISCRRGIMIGGFYDNQNSSSEGADGVHFFDACTDWLVIGVHTYAADDGSSNTIETASGLNLVMERIGYVNCSFRNVGHAGLKAYMNNLVGAARIRGIEYHNCNFITEANPTTGAGAPVSIFLDTGAAANGAKISNIRIFGGMSITLNSLPDVYGQPSIVVNDVDGLEMYGHRIFSPGHTSIFLTRCSDAVISGCTVEHTRGPRLLTSGLVVNSIAYQTGTTVRVTFSTDISALGVIGTGNAHQLIVSGATNDDNNGGFSIVGVGPNYVDIRNYKRNGTNFDETGITASAQVAYTGAASIILWNCTDPRIIDSKVKGASGSASLLISGIANNSTNFTDGAIVKDLQVTGMYFGSAVLDYNSKNTKITGLRLRNSRIDMLINEAGSPGVVHGGARYIDNEDVDLLAARALLKSATVFGKATVNRGNLARLPDTLRGTAVQAANSPTFTVSAGSSSDAASLLTLLHLRLAPVAAVKSVAYDNNRTYTVTTVDTPTSAVNWPFVIEQPNA